MFHHSAKCVIQSQLCGQLSKTQRNLVSTKFCLLFECYKKEEFSGIQTSSPNIQQRDFDSPVYSCKFGTSQNTKELLALAYEDGKVIIQKINNNPNINRFIVDQSIHNNAVFELSWISKKSKILTASADNSVRMADLTPSSLQISQTFKGHTKAVKTVDSNQWDTYVFASSGRDCNIIIWDTRCQPTKKSNEIPGAHFSFPRVRQSPRISHKNTNLNHNGIISVLFSSEHELLSAGASDGVVKMWDLRRTYSVSKREPLSLHTMDYCGQSSYRGFSSMCLSPRNDRVYISCLDGKIYAYQLVAPKPRVVGEFHGHKPKTYYSKCCTSPCGSFLLSGSSDASAYVWLADRPGTPICALTGHTDEVTNVAWSPLNEGIVVTCSDDMTHRVFRTKSNSEPEDASDPMIGKAEAFNAVVPEPVATNLLSPIPSTSRPLPEGTPKQTRSRSESKTPRTNDRTLLTWLSSSKTPKTPSCPFTPTRNEARASTSSSSKKRTLKRKLTDVLDADQENLDKERKTPTSPDVGVLLEANKTATGAAKMLRYEASSLSKLPRIDERSESFTVDEDQESSLASTMSFFGSQTSVAAESPLKNSSLSTSEVFSSPTANLPNFVIDGRSPHSRLEAPVTPHRRADWLTSLGLQKTSKSPSTSTKKSATKVKVRPKRIPKK